MSIRKDSKVDPPNKLRPAFKRKFMTETIDDIYDLILHIDEHGKGLTEWERDFISDHVDNRRFVYTEKQRNIIKRIYDEKT